MGILASTATRPAGSDYPAYWPPPGTRVAWTAVRPIQDLYNQSLEYGIPCLGVIGNTAHLQRHGDHTPWSAGKVRGKVYAGDFDPPSNFGPWLVAKCRSRYPTHWLDFWNFRGRQYDAAGNDVAPSADHHLHMSAEVGYENFATTIFKDYAEETGMAITDDDVTKIVNAILFASVPRPSNLNYQDANGNISNPASWPTSGATGAPRLDYMVHLIVWKLNGITNALARFAEGEVTRDTSDATAAAANRTTLLEAIQGLSLEITDDQLNTMAFNIAQAVVAADNGLTDTDLDGVKNAVKVALREGVGT